MPGTVHSPRRAMPIPVSGKRLRAILCRQRQIAQLQTNAGRLQSDLEMYGRTVPDCVFPVPWLGGDAFEINRGYRVFLASANPLPASGNHVAGKTGVVPRRPQTHLPTRWELCPVELATGLTGKVSCLWHSRPIRNHVCKRYRVRAGMLILGPATAGTRNAGLSIGLQGARGPAPRSLQVTLGYHRPLSAKLVRQQTAKSICRIKRRMRSRYSSAGRAGAHGSQSRRTLRV